MTELAVGAIIDKVAEMGDGDIGRSELSGPLSPRVDSPFSINIHVKDQVMGARDLYGACRYIDFGNLPIPEEVRQFHREKIREREKVEGL
jgi:methylaspartate mutase epsilon subunit